VGKLFWLSRTLFSANLPEQLRAVVGAGMSSFQMRDSRTHGIVSTWKQAVTQLFFQEGPSCKPSKGQMIQFWINPNKQHLSTRNVLLAKHQQAGVSSIKTHPSLSITTIPPLFFLYLHCNVYEF
jgi:hypothetical protein